MKVNKLVKLRADGMELQWKFKKEALTFNFDWNVFKGQD